MAAKQSTFFSFSSAKALARMRATGLTAGDGTGSAADQHFEVELWQAEVQKLALSAGQAVRLLPSKLKLFDRAGAR